MKIDYDVGDVVVCVVEGRVKCPSGTLAYHTGKSAPRKGLILRVLSMRPTPLPGGGTCGCVDVALSDGSVAAAFRLKRLPKAPEHEADFIRRIARPKERVRDREEV